MTDGASAETAAPTDRPRSLGRTASRGAAATGLAQVTRILVQLTGIVVLARMLSPDDYGLVAATTAVIGIGEIFRDFGLFTAAVQSPTLTKAQRSNLFWINTGIGAALTILVISAAPLIAAVYDDDRLTPLTIALSTTFLANGMATQYRADLTRRFRFVALSGTEIAAQVVALVIGVTLASTIVQSGEIGGQWALAAQQVSQSFLLLGLVMTASRWLPGLWARSASVAHLVKFGVDVAAVQLLGYASRNTDTVMIGATLGPGPLGIYNRAFQLLLLPLNQINAPSNRVALPVLSRLRDDRPRFDRFLLFGQAALLHITAAILAFSAAQAVPLVELSLGPQWAGTAPVFQVLAVAGFFQAAAYATGWVFIATGNSRQSLWFTIATRPATILAVVVGSLWGLYGVAWAYTLCMALTWPIGLIWINRVTGAPGRAMFETGARTVIGYAIVGSVSWTTTLWTPFGSPLAVTTIGGLVMLSALAILCLVWPGFRRDLFTLREFGRRLRG
ncbi:lipopolysaccharide biosynthesis protein [Rhodococcus sp. SORGH_AS_0301]|uniref:lipopolysaccharide biosynthesis protein n=1 Tax=Rhodococcus sp. SORGH_AS_0301 TaxID=3041780 RepID=UPI0027817658|nr:lipopolysaccharide biosynthesis protein [Rhodococcus sp. SORGH_AS_0301]MDQ1181540.1 O-antigen/teichoic acid export membrane protein [Rhodococcus sp. SORGH_AS_0301]